MAKKTISLLSLPVETPERSWLFWLLYRHHDALAERWRVRRANWGAVCAWAVEERRKELAASGSDETADPPKLETARKTWQRVRKLKRREAE